MKGKEEAVALEKGKTKRMLKMNQEGSWNPIPNVATQATTPNRARKV